ncbi:MAG: hypothetical protein ACMUJM_12775 [bacterium]
MTIKKMSTLGIFSVFLIFNASYGCKMLPSKNNQWQPVKPRETSFVHIVQWPEETLPIIAQWYTGNRQNWCVLADANPIIDPDHLLIGNNIYIPKDLLKNRKPLAKKYVIKYRHTLTIQKKDKSKPILKSKPKHKRTPNPKNNKPVVEPPPKTIIEDEFELFGPK